jgi:hypothetical protein
MGRSAAQLLPAGLTAIFYMAAMAVGAAGQSVFQVVKPPVGEGMEALSASSPNDIWAMGKDLFLMFKHEETPDGVLHAEEVLRKVAG